MIPPSPPLPAPHHLHHTAAPQHKQKFISLIKSQWLSKTGRWEVLDQRHDSSLCPPELCFLPIPSDSFKSPVVWALLFPWSSCVLFVTKDALVFIWKSVSWYIQALKRKDMSRQVLYFLGTVHFWMAWSPPTSIPESLSPSGGWGLTCYSSAAGLPLCGGQWMVL